MGMRWTIFKEFSFDAAHRLPNVPAGHKCGEMHGHTYRVTVHVTGPLDHRLGWIMDYDVITQAWKKRVHAVLDHQCLNEVIPNPTSELIAQWIWNALAEEGLRDDLLKVVVRETCTAGCEYGMERWA
jgi:6-pyruvoyltetrahydropterin/6-carboxytetrahydropterin synthase